MKNEKSNIELDFKKILMIGVPVVLFLIIGFVLLTSGGGEKEVNPVTREAKAAVEQNQKDKALEVLSKGSAEGTIDKEGDELLVQLKEELYPLYLADAEKAEQEEKYQLAFENYSLALLAIPEGQDSIDLEESVSRTEVLVKEKEQLQKDFTTYVVTFQSAISDSNALLRDFKIQMDGIETGKVTNAQLVTSVKNVIPSSNDIISNLDSGLFIQNQSLLELHKNVISHVNFQHDMFLSSLEIKDANKIEMVPKLKEDILKLKQEQVSMIQTLSLFAEENQLEIDLKIKEGE